MKLKKLLLCFCCILLFCGCSSDTESEAKEESKKTESTKEDDKKESKDTNDDDTEEATADDKTFDLIQYIPKASNIAWDSTTDTAYISNVLRLTHNPYAGDIPEDLLGGTVLGYDLLTKQYIIEFASPKTISELNEIIEQRYESDNVPGGLEIYYMNGLSRLALGHDVTSADINEYLAENHLYKYGLYIPDESHIQINPEGQIRYLDNAIRVKEQDLDSEQEIIDVIGGTISGYDTVGYEDNWYIITFDSGKSLDELKALCDQVTVLNQEIPSQIIRGDYIPGKNIEVTGDLFFVDEYLQRYPDIEELLRFPDELSLEEGDTNG